MGLMLIGLVVFVIWWKRNEEAPEEGAKN